MFLSRLCTASISSFVEFCKYMQYAGYYFDTVVLISKENKENWRMDGKAFTLSYLKIHTFSSYGSHNRM